MMNRRRNGLLIASAAIGVGLMLMFAALSMTGFDFRKFNTIETNTETYEFAEPFTQIEIASISSDVRFARSNDGKARIESVHGTNVREEVGVKNGVLRLEQKGEGGVSFFVWNFGDDERLTVYLPQAEYDALTISTTSGNVDVPKGFQFNDVAIACTSGDVSFLAQCRNDMSIATISGKIEAGGMELSSLKLASTSGKVELTDLRAVGMMEILTISGDIKLDRCDAGELELNTTSGEIKGTLLTGKTFDVHTTSGEIRVPSNTAGAPRCTIHTVSGDVKLSIG